MSKPTYDENELFRLIEAIREERITQKEVERLEAIISNDAQARAQYIRCLTMHGLFEQAAVPIAVDGVKQRVASTSPTVSKPIPKPPPTSGASWWRAKLAFSICFILSVTALAFLIRSYQQRNENDAIAKLTLTHWKVTPTGDTDYEMVSPAHLKITAGEVHIEADSANGETPELLKIQTPAGEAKVEGSDFYVGVHEIHSPEKGKTEMKHVTRVLILAGVATLTNQFGSVTGQSNMLLAAEPDRAPTKLTVQANSDFAFDLYEELAKENKGKNLFYSPYSISSVLAMAAEGARGETAREMGAVLRLPAALQRKGDDAQHIPWRTSLIHTGVANLNRRLARQSTPAEIKAQQAKIKGINAKVDDISGRIFELTGPDSGKTNAREIKALEVQIFELYDQHETEVARLDPYQLQIANALWLERTYPFREAYIATIKKHYDTGVFPADFVDDFQAERGRINQWVEDKTNNRIEELFPAGSLNEHTRFVLTNAIYFKGEWETPFEEYFTEDLKFHLADGKAIETPTMFAPELNVVKYAAFEAGGKRFDTPYSIKPDQKTGLYPDADGFAMLELPYKGDDLSMFIIAPNRPDNLPAVEAKLNTKTINRWIKQLDERSANVYLPKFKVETQTTLGSSTTAGVLQNLGMKRAFIDPSERGGADFSGLCTLDPPASPFLSLVVHKAFIEVNERGAEAAAATGGAGGIGAIVETVPFIPDFRADRPFVYLIREHSTGSILFVGRIMNPAK